MKDLEEKEKRSGRPPNPNWKSLECLPVGSKLLMIELAEALGLSRKGAQNYLHRPLPKGWKLIKVGKVAMIKRTQEKGE